MRFSLLFVAVRTHKLTYWLGQECSSSPPARSRVSYSRLLRSMSCQALSISQIGKWLQHHLGICASVWPSSVWTSTWSYFRRISCIPFCTHCILACHHTVQRTVWLNCLYCSHQVLIHTAKIPLRLPLPRLNSPCSLSLSWWARSSSPFITSSQISLTVLNSFVQNASSYCSAFFCNSVL